MKNTFKFYFLAMIALTLIISCSKTDVTPPATVFCKLTTMVNNIGTYAFSYDTKGNISSYTLTNLDGNNTQQLAFAFVGVFTNNLDGSLLVKTPTKAKNLKTDVKGWVISSTYTLSDGTVTNETSTLSDCNLSPLLVFSPTTRTNLAC